MFVRFLPGPVLVYRIRDVTISYSNFDVTLEKIVALGLTNSVVYHEFHVASRDRLECSHSLNSSEKITNTHGQIGRWWSLC